MRPQEREEELVNGLHAQNEGARGERCVNREQLKAFKTREDESRMVGRAVGFWT